MKALLAGVVSMTTDMGVEMGVGDVSGFSVEEILPWHQEQVQPHCDGLNAFNQGAASAPGRVHFMSNATVVPGLHHIINDMCADANKAMKQWDDWLASFRPVVALPHHRHLRNRLIATCVLQGPHECMQQRFQVTLPSFAEWRWGSVVSLLRLLLSLGPLLRRVWDPVKFASSQEGAAEMEERPPARPDHLEHVDATVLT